VASLVKAWESHWRATSNGSSTKPRPCITAEDAASLNAVAVRLQANTTWWNVCVTLLLSALISSRCLLRLCASRVGRAEGDDHPTPIHTEQHPSPNTQHSASRTAGFFVLWFCLVCTVAGFSPAYIIMMMSHQWFFDAVRQIGPNPAALSSSVHAIAGALWTLAVVHQLLTAYWGIPPRGSPLSEGKSCPSDPGVALRQRHRPMGYIGTAAVAVCAVAGVYILAFSTVSRLADKIPVILDGFYLTVNVLVGIAHVRQKDIMGHKQCMGFAVVWTAWPGLLRALGYIRDRQLDRVSIADQALAAGLLNPQAPQYCHWYSFTRTSVGAGGKFFYAMVTCPNLQGDPRRLQGPHSIYASDEPVSHRCGSNLPLTAPWQA